MDFAKLNVGAFVETWLCVYARTVAWGSETSLEFKFLGQRGSFWAHVSFNPFAGFSNGEAE